MPSRIQLLILGVFSLLLLWISLGQVRGRAASKCGSTITDGAEPAFRQRLVAVGDLHGGRSCYEKWSLTHLDIENTLKVLQMAKIIDRSSNWIGGTDILVQTGDIVDRGAHAIDIYRLMRDLRGEASAVGGQVISLLGNHEIMNAIGDWR